MKFTCLRENLAKGLSTVSKAVPVKHSLPILTNVLIEAEDGRLKLAGTNWDTTITAYVGASVEESGAITVPAKILSEFISHLSAETVGVVLSGESVKLTAGNSKSKFNGTAATDFPDLPEVAEGLPFIELNPKEFANAVSEVGFSVALDDTRPVFSGVYLNYADGYLTVVGSDGFRLSEKTVAITSTADDFSVVLPARTLMEVSRLFSSRDENIKMYLNKDENLCMFECDDVFVAMRIIDGTYPDYKRIIPDKSTVEAYFSSDELLEAVKLTNVFAREADNAVTITIDPKGFMTVSSVSQETGENQTKVDAEIKGALTEPFNVTFNSNYLLEFLTNTKYDMLIFHANDKTAPCLLKPVDEETFLHVMAQMQIND